LIIGVDQSMRESNDIFCAKVSKYADQYEY
jgi:hypothetical protein